MGANRFLSLLSIAMVSVGMLGCGGPEESAPRAAASARAPAARAPLAPAPSETVQATTTQVEYQPPYPERENLFTPPQPRGPIAAQSDATPNEAVELLGFVAVDQPKAVLSIAGTVTSLAAGGQRHGIQVISIAPPEVTLQRGRNRWTASLD